MRKDIHPEYREVLFHDTSVDEYFLVRSTLQTDQTKEWTDGNTYPYCPLDVSSASHPFYTGKRSLSQSLASTQDMPEPQDTLQSMVDLDLRVV